MSQARSSSKSVSFKLPSPTPSSLSIDSDSEIKEAVLFFTPENDDTESSFESCGDLPIQICNKQSTESTCSSSTETTVSGLGTDEKDSVALRDAIPSDTDSGSESANSPGSRSDSSSNEITVAAGSLKSEDSADSAAKIRCRDDDTQQSLSSTTYSNDEEVSTGAETTSPSKNEPKNEILPKRKHDPFQNNVGLNYQHGLEAKIPTPDTLSELRGSIKQTKSEGKHLSGGNISSSIIFPGKPSLTYEQTHHNRCLFERGLTTRSTRKSLLGLSVDVPGSQINNFHDSEFEENLKHKVYAKDSKKSDLPIFRSKKVASFDRNEGKRENRSVIFSSKLNESTHKFRTIRGLGEKWRSEINLTIAKLENPSEFVSSRKWTATLKTKEQLSAASNSPKKLSQKSKSHCDLSQRGEKRNFPSFTDSIVHTQQEYNQNPIIAGTAPLLFHAKNEYDSISDGLLDSISLDSSLFQDNTCKIFRKIKGRDPFPSAIGPTQKVSDAEIKCNDNGTLEVRYKPIECGPHRIKVMYLGTEVNGSPFICSVFDPDHINISKIGPGFYDKIVTFEIDASGVIEGRLETEIRNVRSGVPINHKIELLNDNGSQQRIGFIPTELSPYGVFIRFNGYPIREAPIICEIIDPSECKITGGGIKMAQVDHPAVFKIETVAEEVDNQLSVTVTDPNNESIPCSLRKEADGKFRGEYLPREVGTHRVDVRCADLAVTGSPFQVEVFDLSKVRVIGLKDDIVGKEQRFSVDYSTAGKGSVEVGVYAGGQKLRSLLQTVEEGLAMVSFLPNQPGLHKVDVAFNQIMLPECPYESNIRDLNSINVDGPGLMTCPVNSTAYFVVSLDGAGTGELDVLITAPNGGAVPVKCFQQKDGNFRVEYTPEVSGEHKIDVTFAEQPIGGSPFTCDVFDPAKVRVDPDFKRCLLRQETGIQIAKHGAGKAKLGVKLTDPTGVEIPIEIHPSSSSEEEIKFFPTAIGPHQLRLTYGGYDVSEEPLSFKVEEAGKPVATGEGLESAIVHEPSHFTIDSKKSKGGLKVDISGPNYKAKHSTTKKGDGLLDINYTPIEPGTHTINVLWNNKAISGSPFAVPVLDPSRVKLVATQLDSRGELPLTVNAQKQLSIEAFEAGPGQLRAEIQGPRGKVPNSIEEVGYERFKLSFTPMHDGEHSLYLYWTDYPVPGGPIRGFAERNPVPTKVSHQYGALEPDHLKVVLRGEGLREARTKEESEFIVDGSEAGDGEPECQLMGQKADVPVRLSHLGNRIWKATYTPLIAGPYRLEVLWSGRPVRGSPFSLNVQAHGDATKVVVDTSLLKMGIVDQELKTHIDTRQAGPGTLTAQCIGPQKLAYCELYDHRDGTYTLCIKPNETGKHALVIKFSDEHVAGSPYSLYISHPPDPSKVEVYGPGVEHGILSRYKSNFMVETKGAGAGQLTVRIRGPKGAFNVEMQREKRSDRTIHCKYEPKEPGDYQIEVKWAGEHVPGSPFMVMIYDTQQELERFMAGAPPSPGHPVPFLPPGWMGPPPPGLFLPPLPPGQGPPHPMLGGPPPPQMIGPPPPGPRGHPDYPQGPPMGRPYASSTIYSTGSSRHNKYITAQNGY